MNSLRKILLPLVLLIILGVGIFFIMKGPSNEGDLAGSVFNVSDSDSYTWKCQGSFACWCEKENGTRAEESRQSSEKVCLGL